MWETLADSEGIGLAAPQIGKSIRLVLIDLDPLSEDFPEYKDFKRVYINAHIIEVDEESKKAVSQEGCLSIPGIHENVSRPTRIHVEYDDENFVHHDEWVEGYLARVMQHEFDHLEGKVFVVDNGRISTPLHRSLLDALELVNEGYSAEEIKDILEKHKTKVVVLENVKNLVNHNYLIRYSF